MRALGSIIMERKKLLALIFFMGMGSFSLAREQTERVSVDVKEEKKEKVDVKKIAKPKKTHPAMENKLEKKLLEGIGQTIEFLEKAASEIPKESSQRGDILIRVMGLRLEQAVYVQNQEFDDFDRTWDSWAAGGKKGPEPKMETTKSTDLWTSIVLLGKKVITEYPKASGIDKVFFNTAAAYQYLNREESAMEYYEGLVRDYPASPLVSDAHYSMGEHFFTTDNFQKAIVEYKETLKDTKSPQYGWSLYKLGWCAYNLGSYPEAIQIWEKAVIYSETIDPEKGDRIRAEVLKDMPYAYAEIDKTEEAVSFYKRHQGEKYLPILYKTLANIFFSQGKIDLAIAAWKKSIQLSPASEEAAAAQLEIISLQKEKKDFSKVLDETIFLLKNFGNSNGWSQAHASASDTIRDKSLYYCKILHKEAQSTNEKSYFDFSKSCYYSFIESYKEDKRKNEILEYIGDIEFYVGNYQKAGDLYTVIVSGGKEKAILYGEDGKPTGNNHQRCASNMLDSYNKNFAIEFQTLVKKNAAELSAAVPLSQEAKSFEGGCSLYEKYYSEDAAAAKNCDLILSETYQKSGNTEEAKKKLYDIATKYSKDKEGILAAENLLPYYKSDKRKLLEYAYKFKQIPAYQAGEFGKKLEELIRATEIDVISSEKPGVSRAELYENRAKSNPTDRDADKFLYNAAADYLMYGTASQALSSYAYLIEKYPASSLCQEVMLQSGKLYEETLEFEKSAAMYQQFSVKFPAEKTSAPAYRKACEILIAIDSDRANSVCLECIKKYPEMGKEILRALIQGKIRSGKKDQAVSLLKSEYAKFLTTSNEKAFYFHLLSTLLEGEEGKSAYQQLAKVPKTGEFEADPLFYLGEALLKEALPVVKKVQEAKLEGGAVEALQTSIQLLTNLMAEAESAFGPVLALQDPYWGVSAFYNLAQVYENFALKLGNPPAITGADPKDVKEQLHGSVQELEVKSKEYYKAANDTVEKYQIYSEDSVRVKKKMAGPVGHKVNKNFWVEGPVFLSFFVEDQETKTRIGEARNE